MNEWMNDPNEEISMRLPGADLEILIGGGKSFSALKKTNNLNFDFTQTPLTPSVLMAQWWAMAYSKVRFLSYKMRYHLALELLI